MNERLAKLEKQETAASKTDKDGKAPGGGEKGEDEDNEEKRAALEDEVFEEDDEDGYGHDDDDYLQVTWPKPKGLMKIAVVQAFSSQHVPKQMQMACNFLSCLETYIITAFSTLLPVSGQLLCRVKTMMMMRDMMLTKEAEMTLFISWTALLSRSPLGR